MDKVTQQGALGEAKAVLEFTRQGCDVFTQLSGKAPFDLIIYKDKKLLRVEVKTTISRTPSNTGWVVQLKKVRSNKNENTIYKFNPNESDLLAIYIIPLDKLIIYDSKDIKVTSALTILDDELGEATVCGGRPCLESSLILKRV